MEDLSKGFSYGCCGINGEEKEDVGNFMWTEAVIIWYNNICNLKELYEKEEI